MRIGVDVGGTFTDVVVWKADGTVSVRKFRTPRNASEGLMLAVTTNEIPSDEIEQVVHGTTLATNAVLERRGANTILITTKGFEDLLEIQRGDRAELYDLAWQKPAPLIFRSARYGVEERVDSTGQIRHALSLADLKAISKAISDKPIDAVAIATLFAFLNPAHEEEIRHWLLESHPGLYVSVSSEVAPLLGEYDRIHTTVIDAYVKPLMAKYIQNILNDFATHRIPAKLAIMQSNGGLLTAEEVASAPIRTLLSGPAGGVLAGALWGGASGYKQIVTLDAGGTSTDVGIVQDGRVEITLDTEIGWGLPVRVPMVDVHTVGAGGGSVAWIDSGGELHVGPQSMGAWPGPACYGVGSEPTLTDAYVVCGLIDTRGLAGGTLQIDAQRAVDMIAQKIARPQNVSTIDAAWAMIQIGVTNVAHLVREVITQKGLDPRDFALVAGGGSGPVVSCWVANVLDINRIIIPPYPGLLSAFGLLLAPPRYDAVQAFPTKIRELNWDDLIEVGNTLARRSRAALDRAGYMGEISEEWALDMRYRNQSYSIKVPLPQEILERRDLEELMRSFQQGYERLYGYSLPGDDDLEVVNVRITVQGRAHVLPSVSNDKPVDSRQPRYRQVRVSQGIVQCPIYQRQMLRIGQPIEGPCIIEQYDSTIIVEAAFTVTPDTAGNLVLERWEV